MPTAKTGGDRSAFAVESPRGFLCRCTVCGREERTGSNPLKNGWPKCCGYTMRLEDTEAFVASIDRSMGEIFAPVAAFRDAAEAHFGLSASLGAPLQSGNQGG